MPDRRIVRGDERSNLRAELRRAYEEDGQTIRQLAATYDHSYGRVRALLVEARTALRPRGGSRRAG